MQFSTPALYRALLIVGVGLLGATSCSDEAPTQAPPDRGVDISVTPDLFVYLDGSLALGASCGEGAPCTEGLSCDAITKRCTKACDVDADCGDLVCAEETAKTGARAGARLCRPACDPRRLIDPCGEGAVCRTLGVRAACVVDCRARGCAPGGWICDSATGLCVDPQGGRVGAPCGKDLGNCDGTPNGVCLAVDSTRPGMCTLLCSPFVKPCPTSLSSAHCTFGDATAFYCGFLCDPQNPSCPHAGLECVTVGKDFNVCLPKL